MQRFNEMADEIKASVVAHAVNIAIAVMLLLVASAVEAAGDEIDKDFALPPGFEITEFSGSQLANDIYTLAIDPAGRIFVSGRGYISTLIDDDGDGVAEEAQRFYDGPSDGAMGLLAEEDEIFFTGDGGLFRLHDSNRDGKADGPPKLIRSMKTGDEHTAHAIRRGPDGWLYVLVGNSTRIDRTFAQLPTSPIKDPIAGCVLRFTPDLKHSEVVADGFRNPYDMDFNLEGELFTYDSDNERCVSLPWYEYTRCYHVTPGSHHGWNSHQLAETWRSPPYWLDLSAPVASIARGSPTGVECYRHHLFPPEYSGALFLLDWTFGKIHVLKLQPSGSTYIATPEVFLQSLGSNGFAPTDLAVHPKTGEMYVSIGGRGSRGAVYRVRHTSSASPADTASPIATRQLSWNPERKESLLEEAKRGAPNSRRRALELICRHAEKLSPPEVQRVALANLENSDRLIRQLTARLIAELDPALVATLLADAKNPKARITVCLGMVSRDPATVGSVALELLREESNAGVRLDVARLLQIAVGNVMDKEAYGTVWEGYSRRHHRELPSGLAETLVECYPTGNSDVDRELSRLMAMVQIDRPELVETLAGELTADSDPVEDIHRLIVLSRLPGARSPETTTRVATALLLLDQKLTKHERNRDRNWPLRILETYAHLLQADPRLFQELVASDRFARPGNVIFATAPGVDRTLAAKHFLNAVNEEGIELTAAMVELLGSLDTQEVAPLLRRSWDERPDLQPSILDILARQPEPRDREKYLSTLDATDLSLVELSLEALEALDRKMPPPAIGALVHGFRLIAEIKETLPLRRRYARLLAEVSGRESIELNKEAWTEWFCETYPDFVDLVQLPATDGLSQWMARVPEIAAMQGDPTKGEEVFSRQGCASCHNGNRAVGPTLGGVTKRFSSIDLLTAIIDPNRDVSERYQTELIITDEGSLYQGMVVYEAVDSLILQTGPERTVRIDQGSIAERRRSRRSLMPAGLLDQCSDTSIADLIAYLETLAGN